MTRRAPRFSPLAERHAGNDARRRHGPLDAATLILQLDMAALIRQAGDSLRQHQDDSNQREPRAWWRRLLGKA
jgi:hypothetical protein